MASPVCAFGSPWPHTKPCRGCAAESARLIAEFWRGVFFGLHDADGYTPADRKVQAARAARQGQAHV